MHVGPTRLYGRMHRLGGRGCVGCSLLSVVCLWWWLAGTASACRWWRGRHSAGGAPAFSGKKQLARLHLVVTSAVHKVALSWRNAKRRLGEEQKGGGSTGLLMSVRRGQQGVRMWMCHT